MVIYATDFVKIAEKAWILQCHLIFTKEIHLGFGVHTEYYIMILSKYKNGCWMMEKIPYIFLLALYYPILHSVCFHKEKART